MSYPDLKFGIFLAPFHSLKENPTRAIEQDIALIELLDGLGYDSAWIGEQHSAGVEIIASPELFIAAAAQRTRHIQFGAGISSLTCQHPLVLADRIMQLDHMTRGRVSFGVGFGALTSDAVMMGIKPQDQHDQLLAAIEVLVPLLKGETVTRKTDWFELRVNMAVASQTSPAGARAAGIHGLGLLSISATFAAGFDALATNWEVYARKAKEHQHNVARSNWSLMGPVHIADSREQAFENVGYGLEDWLRYTQEGAAVSIVTSKPSADPAQALVDSGLAVIGTADDAIQQIQRLQEGSGGFGSFLQLAHNWANWKQTTRSYTLFAQQVIPHFTSRHNTVSPAIRKKLKPKSAPSARSKAALRKK
jgi:limonene 1,2-monooxygenase